MYNTENFTEAQKKMLNACYHAIRHARKDITFKGDIEETSDGSFPILTIRTSNISNQLYINGNDMTDPQVKW